VFAVRACLHVTCVLDDPEIPFRQQQMTGKEEKVIKKFPVP
jgi:hypothetical protein